MFFNASRFCDLYDLYLTNCSHKLSHSTNVFQSFAARINFKHKIEILMGLRQVLSAESQNLLLNMNIEKDLIFNVGEVEPSSPNFLIHDMFYNICLK